MAKMRPRPRGEYMKKIYLFCLATMLFFTPAHSANTACTFSDFYMAYYGGQSYMASTTDWVVNDYSGNGIDEGSMRGIAVCGDSALNSDMGDVPIEYWRADNVHCWCKVIYPFETEWFREDSGNQDGYNKASTCFSNCARYCAGTFDYYGYLSASIKIR